MARRPTVATEVTKVLPRFDPDEDFSDVDGDPRNEFELSEDSMDPDRHYHWAHNKPEDIGAYKNGPVPYTLEHYTPDGVRAKMMAEAPMGEVITRRDHVLMSCDLALWEKRQRYERRQTLKTNEMMFKKNTRNDVVVGDRKTYAQAGR